MSANTSIEWTDRTWNVVRGCSRVSPGCDKCYAMGFAHRFSGAGKPYDGLTTIRKGKVDWSGVARFIPGELEAPLRWRKPQRIFVNSMSDLFHNSITDAEILRVWMVMARCPQHTFQILTKRPERALAWLTRWTDTGAPEADVHLARGPAEVRAKHTEGRALMWAEVLDGMGEPPAGAAFPTYDWQGGIRWWPDALPNVWLGVSCENQEVADERIPLLLRCPAAVRFVSAEPLLGPLDLSRFMWPMCWHWAAGYPSPEAALAAGAWAERKRQALVSAHARFLDWVIVGGESGNGARPMHPDWVRSLRDQCTEAGVAFFMKQWGNHAPNAAGELVKLRSKKEGGRVLDGRTWDEFP